MNPKKKFLWYGSKQLTLSLLCDQKKTIWTWRDLLLFKMMVIKRNRGYMLSILMEKKRWNPEFITHHYFGFKTKWHPELLSCWTDNYLHSWYFSSLFYNFKMKNVDKDFEANGGKKVHYVHCFIHILLLFSH